MRVGGGCVTVLWHDTWGDLCCLPVSRWWCVDQQSYMDAPLYLSKYRQLQMRALSVLKSYITDSINNVATAVAHELKTTASVTETLEVSLLYIRFRTQLSHIQPLIALIHKRSDRRRCVWVPRAGLD